MRSIQGLLLSIALSIICIVLMVAAIHCTLQIDDRAVKAAVLLWAAAWGTASLDDHLRIRFLERRARDGG